VNLLEVLRSRVAGLPNGSHSDGIRAVVRHVEAAAGHLRRGQETRDETPFTDAIYRTNQGFEGSLKEAYRVLASEDPGKISPYEIEQYFQKEGRLRPRVLAQFTNYRREWRNPSTHDHRLDFDEDEALLAIVSVCAFAIVLIDQVAEKLSFDAARAEVESVSSPAPSGPLLTQTLNLLKQYAAAARPIDGTSLSLRGAQVTGSLAGFLSATLPSIPIQTDVALSTNPRREADLVIGHQGEQIVVEIKSSPPRRILLDQAIEQVSRYAKAAGIRHAIVYFHPTGNGTEIITEEKNVVETGGTVFVVRPKPEGGG